MVFLVALGGLLAVLFAIATAVGLVLAALGLVDPSPYPYPEPGPWCPCAGCRAVAGGGEAVA